MSYYKLFTVLFFAVFATSIEANAQHLLTTNGKAIVNQNQDTILLRGMGLGGWMVQEGYMLQTAGFASPQHKIKATIQNLIGEANTDAFYDAWLANHCRKSDIDSLKSWGFNSVRLPMHYNLFTLPIEDEPVAGEHTWLTKGFELTDSLISWCAQNQMYVVLDLHAAPGGQGKDAAISDYDPTKPSLWESKDNRDKTVALWKKLATRYANEQWVAGYDLLNEVNWDLPGGVALANLYKEITDSIRTVDTSHILFIEGNWFANDFTGLTPPWDDKIVYSPHKYWSKNDVATMQWVIDLRNNYNVPLYLGESGENSNVWFRDAIRLFEDLDIGWAWWPLKKVESVAGPLSVTKSPEYQTLLNYWNGNGTKPTVAYAKNALMQLTEDLKTENCRFQKDVIDAMFRQVYSDETIPFANNKIPGVIYASDYDMGVVGKAYHDNDLANYSVSTGEYSSWNNGWAYRNDGVDIEVSSDVFNTNGYNVGFLNTDEWMQYEVDIASSGVYNIYIQAASGGSGGRLHFNAGSAAITSSEFIEPTGGWQDWETTTISNVILDKNDSKLRFYVDQAGFNIGSFEFVKSTRTSASLPMEFLAAATLDEYTIQMNANKLVTSSIPSGSADFEIQVNGNSIPIVSVSIDPNNARILVFKVNSLLKSTDKIKISYSGNKIEAADQTKLTNFTLKDVKNTLSFVHQIPIKIEAEDFKTQNGVEVELCTDVGAGQNVGYLDPGDYLDYEVNITAAGNYRMDYRTAAQYGTGGLELQLIDADGIITSYSNPVFTNSGGWQNWKTTSEEARLPAGRYMLRLLITQAPFNLNWVEFTNLTASLEDLKTPSFNLNVFPNPTDNHFTVLARNDKNLKTQIDIFNINGQTIRFVLLENTTLIDEQFSLADSPAGIYYLRLSNEAGRSHTTKLVKMSN